MINTTIISHARDCFVDVTHRRTDPGTWNVQRWRKVLWFRKRISSDWFLDLDQALAYAERLKRDHRARSSPLKWDKGPL
jgi:hypothetical protein